MAPSHLPIQIITSLGKFPWNIFHTRNIDNFIVFATTDMIDDYSNHGWQLSNRCLKLLYYHYCLFTYIFTLIFRKVNHFRKWLLTRKATHTHKKKNHSNEIRELAIQISRDRNYKCIDEEDYYVQYIAQVLKSFDPMTRNLCKC